MKYIKLTQGKQAIVDDADFEWLSQRKWQAHFSRETTYARRGLEMKGGRQRHISMHREIMNTPDGYVTDHINRNGLDNRRCNLRICTRSQNLYNSKLKRTNNTSGYKGVHWNAKKNKWVAQIRTGTTARYLGCFFCLMKAVRAYDKAARKHHGKFARTNFKEAGDGKKPSQD